MWVRAASLAALALAAWAAFGGALQNDWVALDDYAYIVDNPLVRAGWTREGLLGFLRIPHGSNWHPLTSYSHMLDAEAFGLRPAGHHAVSVLLHLANVVLLAHVLGSATGRWWRSVVVAALFGLHPLRVESVAWASERKDVLSMLFFLLTLEAWRLWVRRPGPLRYALIVLACTLGLLSKPMLVSLPLVLVLVDLWPLGRLRLRPRPGRAAPEAPATGPATARTMRGLLLEKWPLFALAAGTAVITFLVQRADRAVVSIDIVPLGHRIANAALSLWRYVGMTLWPARLAPFYPDAPIPIAIGAAGIAGVVVVTILAVRQARARPHLTVGWLWYLITALPVLGLVQVGGQAFADRYTYLPTIGLLVAAVWSVPGGRTGLAAASLALLASLALAGLTRAQVALWRDSRTLFTAMVETAPRNAVAHNGLGSALYKGGRIGDAIREFETAIEINPGYLEPYLNLGELLHAEGRYEEAIAWYERALRGVPGHTGLLNHAARSLMQLGRLDDAADRFERVLRLDPDNAVALSDLGVVRGVQGSYAEALRLLRLAEREAPRDAGVQFRLGKATFLAGGQGSEAAAARHLRRAVEWRPDWGEPRKSLALLLASAADPAVRDPGVAARLAAGVVASAGQGDPDAWLTQALVQAEAARYADAAESARRGLAVAERSKSDSLASTLRAKAAEYEALAAGLAPRRRP